MVFAVQQTRLGEMLPKGRMNTGVSAVLQALFPKLRLRGMEHRVVGPASGKLRVAFPQKCLSRVQGASTRVKQFS